MTKNDEAFRALKGQVLDLLKRATERGMEWTALEPRPASRYFTARSPGIFYILHWEPSASTELLLVSDMGVASISGPLVEELWIRVHAQGVHEQEHQSSVIKWAIQSLVGH